MIWPRVLVGAMFVALPLWAGGFGRSLWTIPPMILVFTLAYIDGKNLFWRNAFQEGDWRFKARRVAGALLAETVLVSALFFFAAGVAGALGDPGPRAPFDRLDASLLALILSLSLGGMALLRRIEKGRDPVARAIERFAVDLDPTDEEDAEEEDSEAEAIADEAEALAERPRQTPEAALGEIDALAARLAALAPPERARLPARRMIDMTEEIEGPNAAAARRAGYRGLALLAERAEGAAVVARMGAVPDVIFALKEDPSDAARLDALALAEALLGLAASDAPSRDSPLMEAVRAVARGGTGPAEAIERDPALRARLQAQAEALLGRRAAV